VSSQCHGLDKEIPPQKKGLKKTLQSTILHVKKQSIAYGSGGGAKKFLAFSNGKY
jgi:hypothetical protein